MDARHEGKNATKTKGFHLFHCACKDQSNDDVGVSTDTVFSGDTTGGAGFNTTGDFVEEKLRGGGATTACRTTRLENK